MHDNYRRYSNTIEVGQEIKVIHYAPSTFIGENNPWNTKFDEVITEDKNHQQKMHNIVFVYF